MSALLQAIGWIEALSFGVLSAVTVRAWARERDPQHAALAWAVGLLAVVTLLGRVQATTGSTNRVVSDLSLVGFLGSGYALLVLRHTFIPLSRRTRRAVLGLVLAVTAVSLAVPLPEKPAPQPSAWVYVVGISIILLWCGCAVEPTVRFWMASRGRPAVQRARLRALSAGYGAIVVLLLVLLAVGLGAGVKASQNPVFTLVLDLLALAIVPVLYVSFAPPAWLRGIWRGQEEAALRRATADLATFAPSSSALAERALVRALRLVGSDRGFILDARSRPLAVSGVDGEAMQRLASLTAGDRPLAVRDAVRSGETAILVPLPLHGGAGAVCALAGAFTPVFGADEVQRLADYAEAIAGGLERTRLGDALASERERMESLLDALSDIGEGIVVTSGERVLYANAAFCALTGRSAEDLVALPSVLGLVRPNDRALAAERLAGLPPGDASDLVEVTLTGADGRDIAVELSSKVLGRGAHVQVMTVCRDVRERRRSQDELARRAAELQRSNAALSEFAYVASHDLQEPLRMVASYLELIERRYRDRLEGEALEFVEFAVDGAKRMQALINDLLAYSRAGSGQGTWGRVDCNAAVARALANLRAAVEESGARIAVAPLPAVDGDPQQISQVFQNLVGNAIKFRGAGPPEVRITATEGTEGWTFAIDDNGIGIEPRHAERIFMIFKRLHSHAEYPGTGIGLSICKKIVERHGGRIWVEASPDGGAGFRFTLPVGTRPAPAEPVALGAARG